MKWVLIIVGILLLLMGAVWILQGTNVFTQGAMAGHTRWTVIGSGVAVIGVLLMVLGATRRRVAKT